MKAKVKILGLLSIVVFLFTACTVSYTTVAEPHTKVLVTTGDLPNKDYQVLGFIESTTTSLAFGLPSEEQISKMKTEAINKGLVKKAEEMGADAVINLTYTTSVGSAYLILQGVTISVKGTAIKFK